MNHFETSLKLVLGHEAGYVNNPNDRGGETNLGISDRRDGVIDGMADINGDRIPDVRIKDLTPEQAAQVYWRDYWKPLRCDELHPSVAYVLFDTAVNAGNSQAVKLLQRALQLTDDGLIGPKTIAAANRDPKHTVLSLAVQRVMFNAGLSTWAHFGKGWTKRIFEVFQQSTTM